MESSLDSMVIVARTSADAVACVSIPRPRSFDTFVEGQDERPIRKIVANAKRVDRPDCFDSEPTRAALVGKRAVDEAIGQHPLALLQCWPAPLCHNRRTRRR